MRLQLTVITVSDRVSRGESTDASGPAIINYLSSHESCKSFRESFDDSISSSSCVVPDEKEKIQKAILDAVSRHNNNNNNNNNSAEAEEASLIITTGGTGFAPRDVTPEAVEPLLSKKAPGLVHAMLSHGLNKYTQSAWLSRAVAGVVASSSLVITLPGSPKAVVECLEAVVSSGLAHALKLLVNPTDRHPTSTSTSSSSTVVTSSSSATAAASSSSPQSPSSSSASAAVADRSRKSDFPMISVTEALDQIINNTPSPFSSSSSSSSPSSSNRSRRTVSLRVTSNALLGSVLARDTVALFPHPPFRASIKDGYAVIASDGLGTFPVAASFCAGANIDANFVLQKGTVCRVNTGGPIPQGADSVIQVEDTELVERTAEGGDEAKIKINIAAKKAGQDIRPIGCDVAPGTVVVKKGTRITSAEVALLSSIGFSHVEAFAKPRIAVLSTGDELIDAATASASSSSSSSSIPPLGKIYDSNRPMLLKAAQDYSNSVVDLGIAKDIHSETKSALDRGFASADVIISTGGVSMGEVDWVKKCLMDSGSEIHFGRVAMKPGKPTTFASKQGKLFFALPGNPVSAMVCFYLFVVPALRKWSGFEQKTQQEGEEGTNNNNLNLNLHLPITSARILENIRPDPERTEYHRCRLRFEMKEGEEDGGGGGAELVATSTGIQASHRLLSMAGANGLLIIAPGKEEIPANRKCKVMVVGPIA